MKLSQRNGKGSGVYGVHHDGLDFHVVKDGMRKGWIVTVRELVETAGVVHSLGQPNLFTAREETLQDVRDALDHWESTAVEGSPSWWRWTRAASLGHDARMARQSAERVALEAAEDAADAAWWADRDEQHRALQAEIDEVLGR